MCTPASFSTSATSFSANSLTLDLQAVIDQAYVDGRYERTDYRQPLYSPLSAEDAAWATDVLRNAGKLQS